MVEEGWCTDVIWSKSHILHVTLPNPADIKWTTQAPEYFTEEPRWEHNRLGVLISAQVLSSMLHHFWGSNPEYFPWLLPIVHF